VIAILISLTLAMIGMSHERPQRCRTVHGRMSLANGTPSVRIWVIGTHRVLGVVQQDESFENLPAAIRAVWSTKGDDAIWATDLYGDFRVCALTARRSGRMQMVVVTSGTRLVGRPRE
jgi:hypothetical protein